MRSLTRVAMAVVLCATVTVACGRDRPVSNDPMAWLGPVPAKLTEAGLRQQYDSLAEQVMRDLRSPDIALDRFVCKRPDEIGPTPRMAAVRAYLGAWPDGIHDPDLVRGLQEAAAAGNWLARVQLYIALEPTSLTEHYRHLQLAQWMRGRKLGALYAQYGDALAASGYYSDTPGGGITGVDIYAALHGSYPAQHKVGKALSEEPESAAVGRAMLACASAALPEYALIFSGAAESSAAQRRMDAAEARLPPLHRAVKAGDTALVSQQLAAAPGKVNERNEDDQTALDLALLAAPPSVPMVDMLISHGASVSEDHPVAPRGEATQLSAAVAAPAPLNLDLVKLLMRAGADPFALNDVHKYVFQTPFADAADLYGAGKDKAVFEFMLASARLSPRSALATESADHYASDPRVFDRLLSYGVVPSGAMLEEFVRLDQAELATALARLPALLARYPQLGQAMRAEHGATALSQAVYGCRFDLAIAFANLGAPFKEGLVEHIADRCDDNDMQGRASEIHLRRRFLELLAARGYDLDGDGVNCVGWLPNCMLGDESVVRELLALGADPYHLAPNGDENGVLLAIRACKPELAELMLAKPPRKRDAATQASLDEAALRAADPYFCARKTDMSGVLARLLALGAAAPPAKKGSPVAASR